MRPRHCLFGLRALAALCLSRPAPAQDHVKTLSAWSFAPAFTTMELYQGLDVQRYLVGDPLPYRTALATLDLPEGSSMTGLELEGCNNSTSFSMGAIVYETDVNGAIASFPSDGVLPMPAGIGCTTVVTSPPAVTYEPRTHSYVVQVQLFQGDNTQQFRAVRIHYQLQVAPPPPAPTFNDVPTSDPAFQYIEALAASGITAGCGGGNYCPDSTLTRRQMAVSLSKGLGLGWPQ